MIYPKISIVTPSFNQAQYLEQTIRSVIDQKYPNIEYIIIDGGSTDGSVDLIRKYESQLSYWVSESDNGQTHAINKGLRRATGDWVAWQNSDDIYLPGSFDGLARASKKHPRAGMILGDMMLIDAGGHPIRDVRYVKPTYRSVLAEGMVLTNQCAFWRRQVHEQIGFMSEELHYAFDYEWFLRLTKHVSSEHVPAIWGGFRLHEDAKTSMHGQRFFDENKIILKGRALSPWWRRFYAGRRFALMLARGQIGYLARGLVRRIVKNADHS